MTYHPQLKMQTFPLRSTLADQLELVSTDCTQCQTCVNECDFLKSYGNPKRLAESYNPAEKLTHAIPFKCSLCELCTAICPHGVNPAGMFLEMRREAFDRGEANIPEHHRLRNYEKRGTSKRFSWYALPENCDTIFFPGCALSGSRSETTLKTYENLQKTIPNIGIVLDCCTKPSHDLGNEDHFNAMFGEMKNYLLTHGIKTVLLACPNCHKIFSNYGTEFEICSVYEVLDRIGSPGTKKLAETIVLHDPCTARFNFPAQKAVRNLLKKKGMRIEEQTHSGKTTLCCGEGGAVGCLAPELAKTWGKKRIEEAKELRIVSYCAGCTHTLGAHAETIHILDLCHKTDTATAPRIAKAPLTYFKRLKLKKYLQNNLQAAVTRERTFQPPSEYDQKSTGKRNRQLLLIGSFFMTALILVSQAWIR